MKKLIQRIKEVSENDEASAEQLALKGMEELGELAAGLFMDSGYKRTTLTEQEVKENILEEVIDVIICMLAILERKNLLNEEAVEEMFNKKIKKWNKSLKKRKKRLWEKENMK
ncbi:MAG: hypothetical protein ACOCVF_02720 [bacterium]